MPSGYTAALYEGEQGFKDFVLTTARGMGALIHMRDTSLDAEITMPEVSDYHSKGLDKARADLKRYEKMDDAEWESLRDEEYEESKQRWNEVEAKRVAREERYNTMLAKVQAWEPPTPDHENFKKYMIDQINESRRFDCSSLHRPYLLPVEDFKQHKIDKVVRDINYHAEKMVEEYDRVKERREWIKALLDSLPEE